MSDRECGVVRASIPDFARGASLEVDVDEMRRHVSSCADCRAELELARLLVQSRVEPPAGLADRILSAVRADRARPTRPWWGVTAAAVAALALGIGLTSEPSVDGALDVPGYAYETEAGDIWASDDGVFAGAPVFDDLSDETLELLLDELLVGSAGGAA